MRCDKHQRTRVRHVVLQRGGLLEARDEVQLAAPRRVPLELAAQRRAA